MRKRPIRATHIRSHTTSGDAESRRRYRFAIVPKVVHPWFELVHEGAKDAAEYLKQTAGIEVTVEYRAPNQPSVVVRRMTPAFATSYAGDPPLRPCHSAEMELMLTMAPPPRASMQGISYFMDNQTPFRLTAMVRSQLSSGQSAIFARVPGTPALLWAQSSHP